jgi:hypothetical protein
MIRTGRPFCEALIYRRVVAVTRAKRWLAVWISLCALTVTFGARAAQVDAQAPIQMALSSSLFDARSTATLSAPSAFKVAGSNGYSLLVVGIPAHKKQPASVAIWVTGGHGTAIYVAPGTVSETSMQAGFGALGEIAVTFHPSGRARQVRPACDGKPFSFDSGSYEGTIVFHGEERFTSAEATSARGDIGFLIDIFCPGILGATGGSFLPGAQLDAEVGTSSHGANVKVVKNRPSARAHYEAGASEVREGVSISRFVGVIQPAGTFLFDSKVQSATLRPSPPFAGTARFHRAAVPAKRWSGDLTVDLPGRSGVKLTGGGDRATLAHAHWDWNPNSPNDPR